MLLRLLALPCLVATAQAVTVSISPTAPTVDGGDIANLSTTTAFTDFQTSVMWGDRPARGQTFTTGASAGLILNSVTVQSTGSQSANGAYTLRIGTLSGTDFTALVDQTSATVTADVAALDYVTFTLDTPLSLSSNTLYAFDIARPASGWQLNNNSGVYSGGQRYTSGALGSGGSTISYNSPADSDRIFHLDIVPEPSTALLLVLGGLGLLRRRR